MRKRDKKKKKKEELNIDHFVKLKMDSYESYDKIYVVVKE
jgi:hypothetical protein